MKEIDGLLSHIDKITHDARSGRHADSHGESCSPIQHTDTPHYFEHTRAPHASSPCCMHALNGLACPVCNQRAELFFLPGEAHQELQEKSDEDETNAPPTVKHGIDHISKALEVGSAYTQALLIRFKLLKTAFASALS